MGISHRDRLAAIVASPSRLRFDRPVDTRVLAMATDVDRAALRSTSSGVATEPVADRVAAVLALLWLGDPAARELLVAVLADPACDQVVASRLSDLAGAPEIVDEHREVLEPWLVSRLGPAAEQLTRSAGWACGRLRVVAAGPRLLELAREAESPAYRDEWPWDSERYLAQAARCWPSPEVVDEIRTRIGVGSGQPPASDRSAPAGDPAPRGASRAGDAAAEVAAGAPVGGYEWALRWCAGVLASGVQHYGMLEALEVRAPESIPLLDEVVRVAPGREGPGMALRVLARVDPASAGRYAREQWRRFPAYAVEVLGRMYRGTADPAVVDLVAGIGAERPMEEGVRCVDALLQIGGGEALAVAGRLMASVPRWASGRRDVERRLERKLARTVVAG